MGNNITELVFVIDRSGSMSSLTDDTIGGFNSMLDKQKHADGRAFVTTVLFNSASKTVHDRVDITEVKPMTRRDYFASGGTALLDAVGETIEHIAMVHKYIRKEDVPEQTIFVITTDGEENSSSKYTDSKVKRMISEKKSKCGWEFLFLGANIDAADTAERYGISPACAVNYCCDSEGTQLNYDVLGEAISEARCTGKISNSWKQRIENDCEQRGGNNKH